jgi:hypothetical protein
MCRCECGLEKLARKSNLCTGTSNGCKKCLMKRMQKAQTKHNMTRSPEYRAWQAMRERCSNPKNKVWDHYGGRGIKVSEEWNEFPPFFAHIGSRPSRKHSLDRIDNEGDYCPGNVRWSTTKVQGRNKRGTVMVTINGETRSLPELADLAGIPPHIAWRRIYVSGWSVERTLATPYTPRYSE